MKTSFRSPMAVGKPYVREKAGFWSATGANADAEASNSSEVATESFMFRERNGCMYREL